MFPVLAVAGNIATGKSKVASFFRSQYGFHPIYADKIGHEVLEEPDVIETLITLLGSEILTDVDTINRKIVGKKVFANKDLLEQFNALIHPRLIAHALSRISVYATKQPVIFEAAILFEAGWDSHFKDIIVTTCEAEEQIKRVIDRDRRSREEASQIIAHQLSFKDVEKRLFERRKVSNRHMSTSGEMTPFLRPSRWVVDTTAGPDSFYPQLHTISTELGVMKVEK